jgi:drug/metabolite transporter (DMT)-like permease
MSAPINRTMAPSEWALLVALSLLWGGSFFFNAVAVAALPPLTIVAARVALGAGFLYTAVRASGARLPSDRHSWSAFAAMGVLNNVIPFTLIVWGQDTVASGLASILNATTPLFTVLVAHALSEDERMTAASLAGVVIGFGGVVILIGPDVIAEAGGIAAELAILAASLSYAFSAVYGRRFSRRGLAPLAAATGQITAAAAIMVPLALVIDRPWMLPMPAAGVWGALLGLGALSTFLAYILYYRLLARAGSVNLTLVTFLIPVSAILLGALFLGEELSANHFLGMAAIALGLAAIDGRPLALLRRRLPG